ncbi:unnamed protein product [Orchesella dallaii]|uniref:Uncharacterized protein n=1 Tax=Orchesella dallaii TaxID=48710 RepID=A0ABP1RGU0_9HEXA
MKLATLILLTMGIYLYVEANLTQKLLNEAKTPEACKFSCEEVAGATCYALGGTVGGCNKVGYVMNCCPSLNADCICQCCTTTACVEATCCVPAPAHNKSCDWWPKSSEKLETFNYMI